MTSRRRARRAGSAPDTRFDTRSIASNIAMTKPASSRCPGEWPRPRHLLLIRDPERSRARCRCRPRSQAGETEGRPAGRARSRSPSRSRRGVWAVPSASQTTKTITDSGRGRRRTVVQTVVAARRARERRDDEEAGRVRREEQRGERRVDHGAGASVRTRRVTRWARPRAGSPRGRSRCRRGDTSDPLRDLERVEPAPSSSTHRASRAVTSRQRAVRREGRRAAASGRALGQSRRRSSRPRGRVRGLIHQSESERHEPADVEDAELRSRHERDRDRGEEDELAEHRGPLEREHRRDENRTRPRRTPCSPSSRSRRRWTTNRDREPSCEDRPPRRDEAPGEQYTGIAVSAQKRTFRRP